MSRTLRVRTPSETIRTGICRVIACCASRPRVGLRPTRPLTEAGIRIEPPPSLAWAIGTAPAATSAAEPAEDAPGREVEVPGRAHRPEPRVLGAGAEAELGELALAERQQPGREVHAGELAVGRARPRRPRRRRPAWVGMPATSTLSLTNVGTPAKKPPRGLGAPGGGRRRRRGGPRRRAARRPAPYAASAASTTSGIDTRRDLDQLRPAPPRRGRPRASSENACTRAMGRDATDGVESDAGRSAAGDRTRHRRRAGGTPPGGRRPGRRPPSGRTWSWGRRRRSPASSAPSTGRRTPPRWSPPPRWSGAPAGRSGRKPATNASSPPESRSETVAAALVIAASTLSRLRTMPASAISRARSPSPKAATVSASNPAKAARKFSRLARMVRHDSPDWNASRVSRSRWDGLAADRHAPLGVVVVAQQRVGGTPGAAGDAVVPGDRSGHVSGARAAARAAWAGRGSAAAGGRPRRTGRRRRSGCRRRPRRRG